MQSQPTAAPARFDAGRHVRTPSGATAKIIVDYPHRGEALVMWANGESARFRYRHLILLVESP
jgi:hypothetical protein